MSSTTREEKYFCCYCLLSEQQTTYVGFTVDLERRLRQHNRELTGGARATHGKSWKRILSVTGFPTKQSALQFEWKWKDISRRSSGATAVERRCAALITLLNLEQSTSYAQPFSTYESPLQVFAEEEVVRKHFQDKDLRYGVVLV
jgi:structure-specific endonuclease subunit SLX1